MTTATAKKTAGTAKAAAKREADPETPEGASFEFEGVKYTIDPAAYTDVELLEAVEDEKYIAACRGYLGKVQWAKAKESLRDPDTGRVPGDRFEPFMQAIMEALGNPN